MSWAGVKALLPLRTVAATLPDHGYLPLAVTGPAGKFPAGRAPLRAYRLDARADTRSEDRGMPAMNHGRDMTGTRLLVTGGTGFIGRRVVAALRSAHATVTVADLAPFPDPRVRSVVGDLREPAVRDDAVEPGLSGIIHLAAVTSVLGSLRDPMLVHRTNVDVTAGLLEHARRRGVARFVLASTNAVVGDVGEATIHEDLPMRPLTPYGATKAAAEMLLAGYAGGYGMTTCALRLTNVYGQGMHDKDSMVARLMRAARDGRVVEVYGSGAQRRDLVHVDDVVAGMFRAWDADHVGPLIIGSGRSVTVLDLVDAARTATGARLPVTHVPARSGEMPAVVVSVARARTLGYEPAVALADGLAGVWADFRAEGGS
jgi:UDP-glucose 4-epimerase